MSVIIRMRLDNTKRIEIKSNTKYNTKNNKRDYYPRGFECPVAHPLVWRDNNKLEYVIPLIHEKYKHTHIE